jgi:hypothetical protein
MLSLHAHVATVRLAAAQHGIYIALMAGRSKRAISTTMRKAPQAFSIDPNIRVADLRKSFETDGWVQIRPFLSNAGAEALRDHAIARDDWLLSLRVGKTPQVQLDREAWDALSEEQREGIRKLVAPSEKKGFRYMFDEIVAVGNDLEDREPSTILGDFARFLSSDPVIGLMRAITGRDDIARADARATRYRPGHFLSVHDDDVAGRQRRAAYVFGLTPSWRPEWGGLLLFHDDAGDVERGLVPRMNSLNLFAVPKSHSVSLVAPFAPVARHAVTGWLRALPDDIP